MDQFWDQFSQFLESTTARVVLWIAVTGCVSALGVYLAQWSRRLVQGDSSNTSELLSNFREIYSQGELEEEEYRAIKNRLGEQLKQELSVKEKQEE